MMRFGGFFVNTYLIMRVVELFEDLLCLVMLVLLIVNREFDVM